ncbi:D-3-phosphoglycerate dehydrogenase/C-terminal binding protein [Hydrogenispora ethanolica]|uniref:D-3-phosphoglycerate dehydrogenase/C-terminal binding protein n=1 Tax=Hydrogenispora ethanolica TaxID=1082276 RepID=A0A4R1RAU4_HYDET|nr:C-terminal binding protein [Hydrogenispora ethanolica]TCL62730.1 D-3-phosphoglycerate dehydrogenase/C-terminal binding protein [Hydrogenispora ethanolica]
MSTLFKVGVLDSVNSNAAEVKVEAQVLDGVAEVIRMEVAHESELPAAFDELDAVIIWHQVKLSRAALGRLKKCRIIVRNGVGFDNVDIQAAGEMGIAVCNVTDYGTEEVADHAIALALAQLRNLFPYVKQIRDGVWDWKSGEQTLRRFRKQVFGIIGLGRIGTAAALRAKAFGFKVLFYDPYLSMGVEKALGIERVETLPELLSQADVISLHCPLNQETRGMIGAEQFAQMKPGVFIVNTARGGTIDQTALKDAVKSGKVAGAGLDVLATEPPQDPELVGMEQILLTPHAAFYSKEAFHDCRSTAAVLVKKFLETGKILNLVNGEYLK